MTERSLSILLSSGDFDRIHYALMTAAAAAAMNRKTSILVTLAACHAFTREQIAAGWPALALSSSVNGIDAATPAELDRYYKAHNIASFADLLDAAEALGISFTLCEMGLRAMKLSLNDFDARISPKIGGLASFMHQAEGAVLSV